MSDIASAGIARGTPGYGTTCRKDVLGRIEVPVVPGAAARARPVPCRQAHIYRIARFFVKPAEAHRACSSLVMLPRVAGHRIPPRPEGRSILRRPS